MNKSLVLVKYFICGKVSFFICEGVYLPLLGSDG